MKKWLSKHKKGVIAMAVAVVIVVVLTRGGSATSGYNEETVQRRDIYTYKSFVGNVEPGDERSVISKVSQQVTEVYVEEGDEVKEGDILAVIDSSTVEQSITSTEISLSSSETSNAYSVADAKRNYENYKSALDQGLNSSLNSAQTSVDNAYTALENAKEDYDTAVWRMDNGVYTTTQSQYTAQQNAQSAYDSASSNASSAQTAYNNAKSAYDAAVAASTKDDPATDPAVITAKEALDAAQANLTGANATLSSAKSALDTANSNLAWAKQNVIESLQSAIDSAQTNYDTAVKNLEVTTLSVNQQLESYRAAWQKAAALSNTDAAENELNNLNDSLDDYTITAPCDGTITSLSLKVGSMVTGGSTVATISDLNAMKVAVNVDEYSILDTGEGSEVTVFVDSISRSYQGKLTRVADTAQLNNGVAYFEATVDFDADEYVKSGMGVEVRLTNADEHQVLTVSTEAVRYRDDNTAYVLVKTEKGSEERDVEIGVSDGNYVEILSGLEEGEIVLADIVTLTPEMMFTEGE